MKRFLVCLAAILAFSLAACDNVQEFDADFLEIYGDFLRYSLDDFELVHEGTDGDRFHRSVARWRTWVLRFEHEDGEERYFYFNNIGQHHFIRSVIHYAQRIGASQLSGEIDGINHRNVFLSLHFQNDIPFAYREYELLIDPQSGISLSSLTWRELVKDWGFDVSITVHSRDAARDADMLEFTKELVRVLSYYVTQDYIDVEFVTWQPHYRVMRFSYCRRSNEFIERR